MEGGGLSALPSPLSSVASACPIVTVYGATEDEVEIFVLGLFSSPCQALATHLGGGLQNLPCRLPPFQLDLGTGLMRALVTPVCA